MKYILILTITVMISGCLSTHRTYNPDGINSTHLSIIVAENIRTGSWIEDKNVTSNIAKVTTETDKLIVKGNFQAGYPKSVSLPSGTYIFYIRCFSRNVQGFERIKLKVLPGVSYRAYCTATYKDGTFGDKLDRMKAHMERKSRA